MMNKKADITITILVIGVIAVCFLTISSFVLSKSERSESFYGIGLIQTIHSIDEELKFAETSEFDTIYTNSFESGNVKVEIKDDEITGIYAKPERKIVRNCDGNSLEFRAVCPKEFVKVVYKRQQ